jgi:hypothetical protein
MNADRYEIMPVTVHLDVDLGKEIVSKRDIGRVLH